MARIWIDVYTKMLSSLSLHSVLFPPFSPKSVRNQMKEARTASWLVSHDILLLFFVFLAMLTDG